MLYRLAGITRIARMYLYMTINIIQYAVSQNVGKVDFDWLFSRVALVQKPISARRFPLHTLLLTSMHRKEAKFLFNKILHFIFTVYNSFRNAINCIP